MAQMTEQNPAATGTELEIPAGLHPVFAALVVDACNLEGQFDPESTPDLAIYLNSLGSKMRTERGYWSTKGEELAARFPGFTLAAEFASAVAESYTDLARRADDVFQQYRDSEHATFARFLEPRVNEMWADTQRFAEVQIDPVRLTDGSFMHGSHNLWLYSFAMSFNAWMPNEGEESDYVIELMKWLHSLNPFFTARARYAMNFSRLLVHGFPAEGDLGAITIEIARGFANLADTGRQLAVAYETRNPFDINRRMNPKVNEHRRDVGNTAMTNS